MRWYFYSARAQGVGVRGKRPTEQILILPIGTTGGRESHPGPAFSQVHHPGQIDVNGHQRIDHIVEIDLKIPRNVKDSDRMNQSVRKRHMIRHRSEGRGTAVPQYCRGRIGYHHRDLVKGNVLGIIAVVIFEFYHQQVRETPKAKVTTGPAKSGGRAVLDGKCQAVGTTLFFIGYQELKCCLKTVLDWLLRLQPDATDSFSPLRACQAEWSIERGGES